MTLNELRELSNNLPSFGDMCEAIGVPRPELHSQMDKVLERLEAGDGFGACNIMLRMGLGIGYLYGKHEGASGGDNSTR